MGAMGDNASPGSHLMRQADRQGQIPFNHVKRDLTPFRPGLQAVQGLT